MAHNSQHFAEYQSLGPQAFSDTTETMPYQAAEKSGLEPDSIEGPVMIKKKKKFLGLKPLVALAVAIFALLVLLGIILGVVLGTMHKHSDGM
jgi:hypothetical protein